MLLPLHLPRRHRRPLLFPPGLLALAWLLWLGCVALPQMRGMGRERVMQLTLAPLQIPYYGVLGTNLIGKEPYFSSLELAAFRPWQEVRFTGNLWNDYFSFQQAQTTVQQLRANPDHDRGLRIQFEPQATYSSLVKLFDLFEVENVKRYWLDIRHSPTTLYTFTTKPSGVSYEDVPAFTCGVSAEQSHSVPTPTVWERLAKSLALLHEPDWRNSTLLLLLMALLSVVRLRWRAG
ncbi:hypothetical protein [Hymenobacter sediminicola]|uniref:Uncharacterized protein n=1 Tax=Hymenobacter sediminicola TaxID=2761579 RepID=A0A7G7W465_9BACT|nr:hypothetical protein [Hymenobacter sediminicola]QNH61158.1 hypothetical protein H4317_13395 [Hymenobacter sediminicola]